jgi:hypothetical protein
MSELLKEEKAESHKELEEEDWNKCKVGQLVV